MSTDELVQAYTCLAVAARDLHELLRLDDEAPAVLDAAQAEAAEMLLAVTLPRLWRVYRDAVGNPG